MKWKWLLVGLGVLIFFGVLSNLVGGKKGGPYSPTPTPRQVAKGQSFFENEYFYFEYPEKFKLVNVPARDGRVYVSVKFEGVPEVAKMDLLFRESTQTLNGLPDVIMRRRDSYQYSEEVARIGDNRGLLFRTADKKERVAYFMKKGRLLQVTMITSGVFTQELEDEFQDLLKSAVWK